MVLTAASSSSPTTFGVLPVPDDVYSPSIGSPARDQAYAPPFRWYTSPLWKSPSSKACKGTGQHWYVLAPVAEVDAAAKCSRQCA